MSEKNADLWSRMYEEQIRHSRHHEQLRAQSTNVVVAMSAAILAFLASNYAVGAKHYALGAFLIIINAYGLLMSLKHYERSRLHATVASKYRDAISAFASLEGKTINAEREAARTLRSRLQSYKAHSRISPLVWVARGPWHNRSSYSDISFLSDWRLIRLGVVLERWLNENRKMR